jgi:hypothetical protein
MFVLCSLSLLLPLLPPLPGSCVRIHGAAL